MPRFPTSDNPPRAVLMGARAREGTKAAARRGKSTQPPGFDGRGMGGARPTTRHPLWRCPWCLDLRIDLENDS